MGELGLTEYGTAALVDIVEERRMAPTENFRKTFFPKQRHTPARVSGSSMEGRRKAARSAPSSARR